MAEEPTMFPMDEDDDLEHFMRTDFQQLPQPAADVLRADVENYDFTFGFDNDHMTLPDQQRPERFQAIPEIGNCNFGIVDFSIQHIQSLPVATLPVAIPQGPQKKQKKSKKAKDGQSTEKKTRKRKVDTVTTINTNTTTLPIQTTPTPRVNQNYHTMIPEVSPRSLLSVNAPSRSPIYGHSVQYGSQVRSPIAGGQVQYSSQVQYPTAGIQVRSPIAGIQVRSPIAGGQVQYSSQVQYPTAGIQVRSPIAGSQVVHYSSQVQYPTAGISPIAGSQVTRSPISPIAGSQVTRSPIAGIQVQYSSHVSSHTVPTLEQGIQAQGTDNPSFGQMDMERDPSRSPNQDLADDLSDGLRIKQEFVSKKVKQKEMNDLFDKMIPRNEVLPRKKQLPQPPPFTQLPPTSEKIHPTATLFYTEEREFQYSDIQSLSDEINNGKVVSPETKEWVDMCNHFIEKLEEERNFETSEEATANRKVIFNLQSAFR